MPTALFFPGTAATQAGAFGSTLPAPTGGIGDWTTAGNSAGTAYAEMDDNAYAVGPSQNSTTAQTSRVLILTNMLRTDDALPIASVIPAAAVLTGLRVYLNTKADVGNRLGWYGQIRSHTAANARGCREGITAITTTDTKAWIQLATSAGSGAIFGSNLVTANNGAWNMSDLLGTGFGIALVSYSTSASAAFMSLDGMRVEVDYADNLRSRASWRSRVR